jgi:hypothetical protein
MRFIYVINSQSFLVHNSPFSFIWHRQLTTSSTNLLCVLPYLSSFSQINWVSSIIENQNIFSSEHSSHSFCCFGIEPTRLTYLLYFINQRHCFLFVYFHVEHCHFYNVYTSLFGLFDF